MRLQSIIVAAVAVFAATVLSADLTASAKEKGRAARVRSGQQSQSAPRVRVSGQASFGHRSRATRSGRYYGSYGYYGYSRPYGFYGGYPWYFGYGFYPGRYYPGYYAYPGYYYGPGDPNGRRAERRPIGGLDLNVRPRKTEIYLDGEYVGLATNFDGYPGHLWLDEGVYQLTFYRDGYETVTRELRVRRDSVLEVRERMKKGESVRPEPPPRPEASLAPGGDAGQGSSSLDADESDDDTVEMRAFPRRGDQD